MPVKAKVDIKIPIDCLDKLPEKIGIVTTIQHLHKMDEVKEQFGDRCIIAGQVLGCRTPKAEKIKDEVDAFLFIGGGVFHPVAVALNTGKDVYTYNPFTKIFGKVKEEEIKEFKKKKNISMVKYLSSERIGILVTTKSGQNNISKAIKLKKKLDEKGKEVFVFGFDTLNPTDLENFPFIECWVNSGCPRIADRKPSIININEVIDL